VSVARSRISRVRSAAAFRLEECITGEGVSTEAHRQTAPAQRFAISPLFVPHAEEAITAFARPPSIHQCQRFAASRMKFTSRDKAARI